MDEKKSALTRRDFMRGSIGIAIGSSTMGFNIPELKAETKPQSTVVINRNVNVMDAARNVDKKIVRKMLEQILMVLTNKDNSKEAWLKLFNKNDIIGLVHTNHLNPTHDEVIDSVKLSLMEAGIPKKNIKMAQGIFSTNPKKCTALICMPALKGHWLTGIGTVLKNYIMFSGKAMYYHGSNNIKLGEIWNLPHIKGKTKLILTDALYPLCDKGPQNDPRYKWHYKGLIAGFDPVAVETIGLKILEKKRELIRGEPWPLTPPPLCIEAADNVYNLGTSNMDKIKIQHFGWEQDILI